MRRLMLMLALSALASGPSVALAQGAPAGTRPVGVGSGGGGIPPNSLVDVRHAHRFQTRPSLIPRTVMTTAVAALRKPTKES